MWCRSKKPAVVPEHVLEPGVHALDRVVGRRPLAAVFLLHLDEHEQRPILDELVQDPPRLAQVLVGVDPPVVLDGELLQKRRPFSAPCAVLQEPRRGEAGVLEAVGDAQGLDPCLELGLQGLTWLATWKVHRCTFVPGHTSLTAAKSGEMPQIAILGAGMCSISAAQADPHSLCARCQPTI